jgi:hypothetical protein
VRENHSHMDRLLVGHIARFVLVQREMNN